MQPLASERLYRVCDPTLFDFGTTETLKPLEAIIGQERAMEAVHFGADIRREGYNLFAMGPVGTGKHSVIMASLRRKADSEPAPSDWCYVNNFTDPRKPIALELKPGVGTTFRNDMQELVELLRNTLPAVFESDEHRSARERINQKYVDRQQEIFQTLNEEAKSRDIAVRTPAGGRITFAPIVEGKIVSGEEFQALPEAEKKRIQAKLNAFESMVKDALHEVTGLGREMQKELRELEHQTAANVVSVVLEELRKKYGEYPRVIDYLDAIQEDIIKNAKDFLSKPEEMEALPFAMYMAPSFQRYKVNLFISNDPQSAAPLLNEENPTLHNLIGEVEHMAQVGALVTDFTLIKAGALHQANGGYLVIDMLKLLQNPFSWDALKRVLRAREIRIESLAHQYSLISTVSLEPEPIPLNIKIVLIGERILYYLLYEYDPEFRSLFKVVADFETDMERNDETAQLYARLIVTLGARDGLMPLRADAVARVIEQSSRYAEDAGKLSTHMATLTDLLRESDYLVRSDKRSVIEKSDIEQALRHQEKRSSRLRDTLYERIAEGTLMINVTGMSVGQINGLSVIELGGYRFGVPSRITARTRIGKGEIIDIERQVKLSGPIHAKGVMILSAYLGSKYAADTPLSLNASLVFEQSYGMVEGDSASSAELYALLSSLSGLPIRQNFAVTGSVNQYGEVQPIGGVNEKIEGFFDIAKQIDPKGEHGIIIPQPNVRHLMLKREVLEAVEAGTFAIYAVKTIDEGIEILSGTPAGAADENGNFPEDSINGLVTKRLNDFAETSRNFAKNSEKRSG